MGETSLSPKREEIRVEGLVPAISHYTDAVRFGDLLFISGVTALDENTKIVGKDDIVVQARYIFESLKKILDRAGATFADVLKVTVLMLDVEDRDKIKGIRKEYFGDALPASTLIGVKALALQDILLEIEAVVGLPGR
jgi:2-iminobutanoate/2-iminopropanoate deaminase